MTGEWRRVLWNRGTLLFLAVLVVVSVYQMYDTAEKNGFRLQMACYREELQVISRLETEEVTPYLNQRIAGYQEERQSAENFQQAYWYERGCQLLLSQWDYLLDYPEYREKVRVDAARIMGGGVFGSAEGYSANNARRTLADFERLGEVQLSLGAVYGIEKIVDEDYSGFFAAIFLLFLIVRFAGEYQRGLWDMIYAGARGRLRLAGSRVAILFAGALISILCLYGTRILTGFALYGGKDTLSFTVQSSRLFQKCTLPLTMGEMLTLIGILHLVAACFIGCFFWFLFVCIPHEKVALAVLLLIAAVEYFLSIRISASSTWLMLRDCNLFSFMNLTEWFSSYQNDRLGELALGQWEVKLTLLLVIGILSLTVVLVKSCCRRPKNVSPLPERLLSAGKRRLMVLTGRVPAVLTEWYKILFYERGWLVLVVFGYLTYGLFSGRMALYYDSATLIEDRVYTEISGDTLDVARRYLGEAEQELEDPSLDPAVISMRQTVYASMAQELDRLEELEREVGHSLHLVYPYGYRRLLQRLYPEEIRLDRELLQTRKQWTLYELMCLVFLLAGCFPYERRARMTKLLEAANGGRERLWRRKKWAAALGTTLLWAVGVWLSIWQLLRSGAQFGGLWEPAAVLPFLSEMPSWVSLGGLLGGVLLLRLLLLQAMTGILLYLSAKSKNSAMALGLGFLLLAAAGLEFLSGAFSMWLPLTVMDGLQLLYEDGWIGVLGIASYLILGALGFGFAGGCVSTQAGVVKQKGRGTEK